MLDRMRDVQLTLVDLSFALNEIHLELLTRSLTTFGTSFTLDQDPLHSLALGGDNITSKGNDTVVGDGCVIYIQIDSTDPGFEFAELGKTVDAKKLTSIMNRRQDELDQHAADLAATLPLTNSEQSSLPFWDVPFYIVVGGDSIDLHDNQVIAVGDFAVIGLAYSTDSSVNKLAQLSQYSDSVEILRRAPSISSYFPRLTLYTTEFYHIRYDSAKIKQVEPMYHGDDFVARSDKNVVFGDYLSAPVARFSAGDALDLETTNFFGIYQNAQLSQTFSPDTIDATSATTTPWWIGQKASDVVLGATQKGKTDAFIIKATERIFNENGLTRQAKFDFNNHAIPYNASATVNMGPVCSDPAFSYFPEHTFSVYLEVKNEALVRPVSSDASGNNVGEVVESPFERKMTRKDNGGEEQLASGSMPMNEGIGTGGHHVQHLRHNHEQTDA